MRHGTVVLWFVLAAQAGTTPKSGAAGYPVHGQIGGLSMGAEFMVHSFSSGRAMFVAEDYLVVEVALYPANSAHLAVSATQFSLLVSGKKQVAAQAAEFVAVALQTADWQTQRPLDPQEQPVTASEVVVRMALPEGEASGAVSGYLYFPYRGKIKGIHSLELHYDGPAGKTTLPLR